MVKKSACQYRRHRRRGFDPWVEISWRRKWQSIPVFLPGESLGQRSLAGYSSWGHKESDKTEHARTHTHIYAHTNIYMYLTQVKFPVSFLDQLINFSLARGYRVGDEESRVSVLYVYS